MMKPRPKIVFALLAVLVFVVGCGNDSATGAMASDGDSVTVTDAWSRHPAPGVTTIAVYASLVNDTDREQRVVAVSTAVSDRVELHETVVGDDGFAAMRHREEGLVVPAGGTLVFQPGGAHVMVFDVNVEQLGTSFEVIFEFDTGDEIIAIAELTAPGGVDVEHADHSDPESGS